MEQATWVCGHCGQRKTAEHFYRASFESKRKGFTCRVCERARAIARYRDTQSWVNEIKMASGCLDCGYRKHPAALEFDHLPGTVKVATINVLVRRSQPRAVILAEMAKCELVCANCHRVRTMTREDYRNGTGRDLRVTGSFATRASLYDVELPFD